MDGAHSKQSVVEVKYSIDRPELLYVSARHCSIYHAQKQEEVRPRQWGGIGPVPIVGGVGNISTKAARVARTRAE